jgi:exo-1,4-beta-D-glucosaminidase
MISKREDVLKSKRTKEEWFYSPITDPVSFSKIHNFKKSDLEISKDINNSVVTIKIENIGDSIALGLYADLIDDRGDIITPTLWSDNYIYIFPQESVELKAELIDRDLNKNYRVRVTLLNGDTEWL